MNRQLPLLTSDEDAERFLDTADLSEYDLNALRPHSFEFARKSKQVNMRMPEQLLDAVKAKATERGMSYQRFIRQALELAIHPSVPVPLPRHLPAEGRPSPSGEEERS